MSEQTRQHLKTEFENGERPSGDDFADLLDSFLHRSEDGLTVDAASNLVLAAGVRLGDSNLDEAGGLRLSGGAVQFHDGTTWVNMGSGGGGAFEEVGGSGEVAYTGGNVGVGTDFGANPPTFRLEVDLGDNDGESERVRFGSVVCSNGPAANQDDACFYHRDVQDDVASYALRQRATGEVRLNAPATQRIRITHGGNQARLTVTDTGNVVVRRSSDVPGAPANAVFQVNGDAFKNTPGDNVWRDPSDARLKDNVRDLEVGLDQLLRVRPVRFSPNGKAGVKAGGEKIGIIGQEIEQIFPEMIERVPAALDDRTEVDDLRVYNGSAMTYILINAVKELAAKVERLEAALTGSRGDRDDG